MICGERCFDVELIPSNVVPHNVNDLRPRAAALDLVGICAGADRCQCQGASPLPRADHCSARVAELHGEVLALLRTGLRCAEPFKQYRWDRGSE